MKVIQIKKELPKRETYVCDICGYEREWGSLDPLIIQKTEGDYTVSAYVCRTHFGINEGEIVYTPHLLRMRFEVENKAKELGETAK